MRSSTVVDSQLAIWAIAADQEPIASVKVIFCTLGSSVLNDQPSSSSPTSSMSPQNKLEK